MEAFFFSSSLAWSVPRCSSSTCTSTGLLFSVFFFSFFHLFFYRVDMELNHLGTRLDRISGGVLLSSALAWPGRHRHPTSTPTSAELLFASFQVVHGQLSLFLFSLCIGIVASSLLSCSTLDCSCLELSPSSLDWQQRLDLALCSMLHQMSPNFT